MYSKVLHIDKETGEVEEVNSIDFLKQVSEIRNTMSEVNVGLITIFSNKKEKYHAYRYG